jgi:hypothetical protein
MIQWQPNSTNTVQTTAAPRVLRDVHAIVSQSGKDSEILLHSVTYLWEKLTSTLNTLTLSVQWAGKGCSASLNETELCHV